MFTDNIKLTEIVVNELLQRYLSTHSFANLTNENVSVEVGYLSGPEYSTNSRCASHISVSDCIKLTHTDTKTHIFVAIHTKDTPVAIMRGLRELDEMIKCGLKHPVYHLDFFKIPE